MLDHGPVSRGVLQAMASWKQRSGIVPHPAVAQPMAWSFRIWTCARRGCGAPGAVRASSWMPDIQSGAGAGSCGARPSWRRGQSAEQIVVIFFQKILEVGHVFRGGRVFAAGPQRIELKVHVELDEEGERGLADRAAWELCARVTVVALGFKGSAEGSGDAEEGQLVRGEGVQAGGEVGVLLGKRVAVRQVPDGAERAEQDRDAVGASRELGPGRVRAAAFRVRREVMADVVHAAGLAPEDDEQAGARGVMRDIAAIESCVPRRRPLACRAAVSAPRLSRVVTGLSRRTAEDGGERASTCGSISPATRILDASPAGRRHVDACAGAGGPTASA